MWKKPSKTKEPNNAGSAYDYAVFLLGLKLRTVGEIREKMDKRGYNPEVIEKIIDQLHGQRYLDDRRYAEIFLDNLKAYRNLGWFGIKRKFMMKKLPVELIDEILGVGLSREEELSIAKRLLIKEGFAVKEPAVDDSGPTYSMYGNEEKNQTKQKMIQRLKSRGFRSDIIAKLLC